MAKRSLPSRSLPSQTLPYNVLKLIQEYSKPLTRPDWRRSKPIITSYYIYKMVHNTHIFLSPLIYGLYMNIMQTQWYGLFIYVRLYGLNGMDDYLMKIDGIDEALNFYVNKLNKE
jgi:hypothetical protein